MGEIGARARELAEVNGCSSLSYKIFAKYFCKIILQNVFGNLFCKIVGLCYSVCFILIKFNFTCVLRLMPKIVSLGREASVSALTRIFSHS